MLAGGAAGAGAALAGLRRVEQDRPAQAVEPAAGGAGGAGAADPRYAAGAVGDLGQRNGGGLGPGGGGAGAPGVSRRVARVSAGAKFWAGGGQMLAARGAHDRRFDGLAGVRPGAGPVEPAGVHAARRGEHGRGVVEACVGAGLVVDGAGRPYFGRTNALCSYT